MLTPTMVSTQRFHVLCRKWPCVCVAKGYSTMICSRYPAAPTSYSLHHARRKIFLFNLWFDPRSLIPFGLTQNRGCSFRFDLNYDLNLPLILAKVYSGICNSTWVALSSIVLSLLSKLEKLSSRRAASRQRPFSVITDD